MTSGVVLRTSESLEQTCEWLKYILGIEFVAQADGTWTALTYGGTAFTLSGCSGEDPTCWALQWQPDEANKHYQHERKFLGPLEGLPQLLEHGFRDFDVEVSWKS